MLYDPLRASDADAATQAWWSEHVVIQSAMFGPIGGGDRIPAYRLSHDSRLGVLRLAAHWSAPSSRVLSARLGDGLALDLRSEGYRALGPVPGAVSVRVVSEDPGGRRKALNHWNKTAKGRFVALLGHHRPEVRSMGELASWASGVGVVLDRVGGTWELVAESLGSDTAAWAH